MVNSLYRLIDLNNDTNKLLRDTFLNIEDMKECLEELCPDESFNIKLIRGEESLRLYCRKNGDYYPIEKIIKKISEKKING